jgi:clathrin heavy chain
MPELTFLYVNRKEYNSATMVIVNHSVDAWEHGLFKKISPKVASAEILYKAIQFYLEEHPLMVNDLLTSYVHCVDHTRVINLI